MYVEHGDRLDRLARWVSAERALTLIPLQNSLIRFLSGFTFYLLLPVTILLFAWKAAVFPNWGLALFSVAAAVIASHIMLPLRRFSWRSRALVSAGVGAIACGVLFSLGPPRRAFDLVDANLSGQWLPVNDLSGADLGFANLTGVELTAANLSGADLSFANLNGANLSYANLSGADLTGANLTGADLRGAKNLIQAQLDRACGNSNKLPGGLTLKPCPG
jgi:hypothetical protein